MADLKECRDTLAAVEPGHAAPGLNMIIAVDAGAAGADAPVGRAARGFGNRAAHRRVQFRCPRNPFWIGRDGSNKYRTI